MALIGLYLFYIIFILLIIIYMQLIFKCKRGVKISVEVLRQVESSKIKLHNVDMKSDILVQPPGPLPLPIIGNLGLLGKYAVPFEGFSALSRIYGKVYSLTLGTIRCVIVNDLDTIKEVLNQNGKFFGGRPDFEVRKSAAQ
jgi:cytochrome P450 family 307 subfamily A